MIAAIALLWLALLELTSYAGSSILAKRGLLHVPEDGSGYEAYLKKRDPILGWPASAAFGKGEFDAAGSRLVPSFAKADPRSACVSFFGDSFTWGDEVGPAESFPNVVAQRLGCRVNNFGVGGYGTDQAFLRYRDVIHDQAPYVVLGHYTENIIRNVNQFRSYISPSRFGLKPRFIVDAGGSLRLVPLPKPTRAQYAEIARGYPDALPHEYWRPGAASSIVTMRFPFTLAAARFFGHYRVRAKLNGVPSYQAFYDAAHKSRALLVTRKIIEAFVAVAKERGQRPIVALIPDIKDLEAQQGKQPLPYEPLRDGLRKAGIETVPIAEALLAYLDGRAPVLLYTRSDGGHFNAKGYALVAEAVAARIRTVQAGSGAGGGGAL